MSASRRGRRAQERSLPQTHRKLNWAKIGQVAKVMVIGYAIVALLFGMIDWFIVARDNKSRQKINADGLVTNAVIDHVYHGKHTCNCALYHFYVSGRAYNGQSLKIYKGLVGDSIQTTYSRAQPSLNLPSSEMSLQTLKSIVTETCNIFLVLTAASAILMSAVIIFKTLTGDKKVLNEITTVE